MEEVTVTVTVTHWPQRQSRCCGEERNLLPLTEITLFAVQAVAHCCTDRAVLAPVCLTVQTLVCWLFLGRGQQWGAEPIWQQYCRNSGQQHWSVCYCAGSILGRSTSSSATAALWGYQHWVSHTAWGWKHQFSSHESGFSLSSMQLCQRKTCAAPQQAATAFSISKSRPQK
jgi:hypothetical protein